MKDLTPREQLVSSLRGFFLCPILVKLGELGFIDKMLEESFSLDDFQKVKNKENFSLVIEYLESIGFIEVSHGRYRLTRVGRSVMARWGSFALLYSYRELVDRVDQLITVESTKPPACDRRYNVIGSGLTNGRKFFPAGIDLFLGYEISSITDLCCGDGEFLKVFGRYHPKARLNACDLSEVAIEESKKKLQADGRVSYMQTDALLVENWQRLVEAGRDASGIEIISMWYLLHEISGNSVECLVSFLKNIQERMPEAHLLVGEIVRTGKHLDTESIAKSIIPEFMLFHDFSGQGVLSYDDWNRVWEQSPYEIVKSVEFDIVKDTSGREIPSAFVYHLKPVQK